MLKVLCTVVIILADGYRDVRELDGFVVKEGVRDSNEYVYVDFGDTMPTPQVRWVRENDCQYYEDPSKHYADYLANKRLQEEQAKADRERWRTAIKRMK